MITRYVLNSSRVPEICEDLFRWSEWMATANRRVAFTDLGFCHISTVFLGASVHHGRPDELWETMVFGGPEMTERCSGSWEQAEAMHANMVELIRKHASNP